MARKVSGSRTQRRAMTKSALKKFCINRTKSMKALAHKEYGAK